MHRILVCLSLFIAAHVVAQTSTKITRAWKSADGRDLVAELVDYNATQIKVKRAGSAQPLAIPLASLSEADRKFVLDLIHDRDRDTSLTKGPYAEKITGDFVPLTSKEGLKYQLFGSPKWDSKMRYPLVIPLHGTMQCGNDNKSQLGIVTKTFTDLIHQRENPCFVVAPQCEDSTTGWDGPVLENLIKLVNELCDNLPIDRDRIYLTGASMGGVGSLRFAAKEPGMVAGLVIITASGDASMVQALKDVPVLAFHGADDAAVPPARTSNFIKALTDAGSTVAKYTELRGEGRNVQSVVYARESLYKWLFAQKRVR